MNITFFVSDFKASFVIHFMSYTAPRCPPLYRPFNTDVVVESKPDPCVFKVFILATVTLCAMPCCIDLPSPVRFLEIGNRATTNGSNINILPIERHRLTYELISASTCVADVYSRSVWIITIKLFQSEAFVPCCNRKLRRLQTSISVRLCRADEGTTCCHLQFSEQSPFWDVLPYQCEVSDLR